MHFKMNLVVFINTTSDWLKEKEKKICQLNHWKFQLYNKSIVKIIPTQCLQNVTDKKCLKIYAIHRTMKLLIKIGKENI